MAYLSIAPIRSNASPKKLYLRKGLIVKLHLPRWLWLGLSASVGLGGGAFALGWLWINTGVKGSYVSETLEHYARPDTLTIQDADGSVLLQEGPITHETVSIAAVPDAVKKVFIASEAHRAGQHQNGAGSGTLAQRLAQIAFLDQDKGMLGQLNEIRLAKQIEKQFDQDEILEYYLNLVYLGSGAYGLADAAWVYFGKTTEALTLPEAAMLAGIVPAPDLYSPLVDEAAATNQRNSLLEQMAAKKNITATEAEQAIATPLVIQEKQPKRLQRRANYFTDYVRYELADHISSQQLAEGGIVVETTLNPKWQKAGEALIDETVAEYGKWRNFSQVALVAIDPRSGAIQVMVGGQDFEENQFNRVTQAQRQPGSTFKTFIYATAIAAGFSPNKQYLDTKLVVDDYEPRNNDDRYRNGYVSLNTALTNSINMVAIRTLLDLGWEPVMQTAKAMGIESKLQSTYSLALGSSEVNLLELTSAYGTLANQGVHQSPYAIARILDRQGEVLYEAKPVPKNALNADTSAIVTDMLQQVVDSGTGKPAQIGRPVAGKTGTTDDAQDIWFIGFIPQVVAGIWFGNDDFTPTSATSGFAAQTWRQFMLQVVDNLAIATFPDPPEKLEGRPPQVNPQPIQPQESREVPSTVTTQRSPSQPTQPTRRPVARSSNSSPAPTAASPSRGQDSAATNSQPAPGPSAPSSGGTSAPSTAAKRSNPPAPSPETTPAPANTPAPAAKPPTVTAAPQPSSPTVSPPTQAFPTPKPASVAPTQSVPAPANFPSAQPSQSAPPTITVPTVPSAAPSGEASDP